MIGDRFKASIAEMEAARLARIERKGKIAARVMRRSMKATLIDLEKERLRFAEVVDAESVAHGLKTLADIEPLKAMPITYLTAAQYEALEAGLKP